MKIIEEQGYYVHEKFAYTVDDLAKAKKFDLPKMSIEELEEKSKVKFNRIEKILLGRADVEVAYIENFGFVSNISPYEDTDFFLADLNRGKCYLEEKYATEKYGYNKKLTQEELEESWVR